MDYKYYVTLSDKEKDKYPKPMLTLKWFDPVEIYKLQKHSWFSQLRNDLNQKGKFSLNFGLFKYEQTGSDISGSKIDANEIVKTLFEKTTCLSLASFKSLLKDSISKGQGSFFEPSLVVLDGEINILLKTKYIVDRLFRLLAEQLGYRIDGSLLPTLYYDEKAILKIKNSLTAFANLLIDEKIIDSILRKEFNPDSDLLNIIHGGKTFFHAIIVGMNEQKSTVDFHLALPPSSVEVFPKRTGINGRVLGWLEHGVDGFFFIRVIALGAADLLQA